MLRLRTLGGLTIEDENGPLAGAIARKRSLALLALEHATYVVAGILFWWCVWQDAPHRLSAIARAGYVFAAFVLSAPLASISPLSLALQGVVTAPRDAVLRVVGSWGDGSSHTLAEQPVRLVPALLRERPYGDVVSPENTAPVGRE